MMCHMALPCKVGRGGTYPLRLFAADPVPGVDALLGPLDSPPPVSGCRPGCLNLRLIWDGGGVDTVG